MSNVKLIQKITQTAIYYICDQSMLKQRLTKISQMIILSRHEIRPPLFFAADRYDVKSLLGYCSLDLSLRQFKVSKSFYFYRIIHSRFLFLVLYFNLDISWLFLLCSIIQAHSALPLCKPYSYFAHRKYLTIIRYLSLIRNSRIRNRRTK